MKKITLLTILFTCTYAFSQYRYPEKEMANLATSGLLTDEFEEQILAAASQIIEQINAA